MTTNHTAIGTAMVLDKVQKALDGASANWRAEGKAIAAAIDEGTRADHLASKVNNMAEYEGQMQTYRGIKATIKWFDEHGDSADFADAAVVIRSELLAMIDNGVDDRWSGRTNDVRRANYDGIRIAIKQVQRMVESCER